ncbi:uncharacterized protein LOC131016934 isoform X2 [Salvia miltiorrhiza]|uniref:uncharacterized protein LOC131016934 isoform X2 n=1 Tax=Salvia miltiorrhiza TaxID=226208 RepID=UPI0025AB845D|nr:uncharacterized protein LOC131016934 isoform X2 [Salvia miltiorrhiza]
MKRREAAGAGFDKAGRISSCFKDIDEELSFFRELKKREKDQFGSLLNPISDDFEANGSFGLSIMNSGGRKGAEFLGKNDYNWLKTPPATPLFPSLEMESNAQELVVQREIPIIQPISRFIDKRNMKSAPLVTPKPNKIKSSVPKNFPNSNTSRNSTCLSARSSISNETPPNLRPSSATRGRPAYQNLPAPPKIMRRQPSNAGNVEKSGGVQVAGSRMVDKLMNARMSNADDRRSKIKLNGSCNGEEKRQPKIKLDASLNETSGFGRLMMSSQTHGHSTRLQQWK